MVDSVSAARAKRVDPRFAFQSPGDHLHDTLVSAGRRGALPAWVAKPAPGTLGTFERTLDDLKLTVTLTPDGRATVQVDGPSYGRPIDPGEFNAKDLESALAGLPTHCQDIVGAALATKPAAVAQKAAPVQVEPPKPQGSWWQRLAGSKSDKSSVDAAKDLASERLKVVTDAVGAVTTTLTQLEKALPQTPAFANFFDTSSTFRTTLACAQRLAQNDGTFMSIMRQQYARQIELIGQRADSLYKSGDLAGTAGVADTLEAMIRTSNDQLVDYLNQAQSSNLSTDIAAVAGATGTGYKTAIGVVQSAAEAGVQAALGFETLLSLKTPATTRAPSNVDLINAFNTNPDLRFFATFSDFVAGFLSWENEEPYKVFEDDKFGPTDLWFYSGGFTWRDATLATGFRDVIDSDLKGTTYPAIVESLEATAQQIENGLRAYFRPQVKGVDGWNKNDLLNAFKHQVGSPSADVNAFKRAMNEAGYYVGEPAA